MDFNYKKLVVYKDIVKDEELSMPMYEFFCSSCSTIYTFLSKSINIKKTPCCPKNPEFHQLTRMVSRFAFTGNLKENSTYDDNNEFPETGYDESKIENAMQLLASEAEHINKDDPRQAANLIRKLTDMTGFKLGDKMEDAISRMESGDDPEAIEHSFGDVDDSDLFKLNDTAKKSVKKSVPFRDETLYDM